MWERPEAESVGVQAKGVCRGAIVRIDDLGAVIVRCAHHELEFACDVLETTEGKSLTLATHDEVVVLHPSTGTAGVILGRIRSAFASAREEPDTPEELVLEAKRSLTLRVGDGSITIREDGKILIKGKDLVSHAQRMNRIKGGAVSIN